MKQDIYTTITERIIKSLEQGAAPWRKPWQGSGRPRNAVTGRPYSGINFFLLACHGGERFLTYKQAQKLGGNVKKGERGCPVVYWSIFETEKNGEVETIPFLKHFTVFAVDQCEGLNLTNDENISPLDFVPIERAQNTIDKTKANIQHGGHRAFYNPTLDKINLPSKEDFTSVENYYAIAFHELAHWTGHHSRLNRKNMEEVAAFGDEAYSKEELVAEMTSAFLCIEHGIEATYENNVAYLQRWIAKLKGDSKLVLQASGAASKAAKYILGDSNEEDTEE